MYKDVDVHAGIHPTPAGSWTRQELDTNEVETIQYNSLCKTLLLLSRITDHVHVTTSYQEPNCHGAFVCAAIRAHTSFPVWAARLINLPSSLSRYTHLSHYT